MKKFFNAGYELMSFDTESNKLAKECSNSTSCIDYVFVMENDGIFTNGEEEKEVQKGDLVIVLYPIGGGTPIKPFVVLKQDNDFAKHIAKNKAYHDDIRAKRMAEESKSCNDCDQCCDTCCEAC